MNTERIKKLQDFANEFNKKLKLSEESQIKENKLALLLFNTFLPFFVDILLRNPCSFILCLFLGCKVIFMSQYLLS